MSAPPARPPHGSVHSITTGEARPAIVVNPIAEQAIIRAILGGAGHEWITLLNSDRSAIKVERFGTTLQFSAKGLVAEEPPYLLPSYSGSVVDRVTLSVAAAVVLKKHQIELGAIMRGPFTHYDGTDYVVFGIDRGEGGSLPPILPSEPWVTADAIVTIAVGPNGSTYSGTVTDRLTGVTQTIDPRNIQVRASVVRVLLGGSQLPSQGKPLAKYRFAAWAESQLNPSISQLASIAPQDGMLPIGVESTVAPTMK